MLTKTELLAGSTRLLEGEGYTRIDSPPGWDSLDARAFEDMYGVVAIFVFETWKELRDRWSHAQALLVDLISTHIQTTDPKAWDGYLVLVTPSTPSRHERIFEERLRYDTNRVRKIVGTGDTLQDIGDLRFLLMPLFPLVQHEGITFDDPMDILADILSGLGVPAIVVRSLFAAFENGTPLMDAIHDVTEVG